MVYLVFTWFSAKTLAIIFVYVYCRYYEFVDANENPIGLQTIACQNGGWGQIEESSCVTGNVGFSKTLCTNSISTLQARFVIVPLLYTAHNW